MSDFPSREDSAPEPAPIVPPRDPLNEFVPDEESPGPPQHVAWMSRGSVVGLLLRNLGLNILTLGFYRFWGRTRLRRFLWGNVALLGDPLVYTGTGIEMFKGFLFALVVLIPLGALSIAIGFIPDPAVTAVANALYILALIFLLFMAVFLARRYRLSRTVWRGVRCGLAGKPWDYAWRKFVWSILTILSLGFAYPWLAMRERRYLMERTYLGDRAFAFDGRGSDLFGSWLIVYLTLGIGWLWFQVKQFRYMTSRTKLADVAFASEARVWPYLGRFLLFSLVLSIAGGTVAGIGVTGIGYFMEMLDLNITQDVHNQIVGVATVFPVLLFSQILIWPMVFIPYLNHICVTLRVSNSGSLASIAQSAQAMPERGEGLADAFDVGLT